jgi:adenosylcobinamide-GDP ribazoletransferase
VSFLAALQFLTTIPLPGRREFRPEVLGRSTVFFPLIGLIIGLIMGGWRWLLGLLLPQPVANVVVIASLVLATGALHLDGFLDTCDGLAGHKSVEERWQVMHDSRAGGFGVIGVAVLLLVKYVSLTNVPASLLTATLVLTPVLSRWAMVYAVFIYPYARPAGLGKVFKERTSWVRFAIATAVAFVLAAIILERTGVYIMTAVWLMVVVVAAYLKHQFAGLTGDTYGAINELAESLVFIVIIVLARLGLA